MASAGNLQLSLSPTHQRPIPPAAQTLKAKEPRAVIHMPADSTAFGKKSLAQRVQLQQERENLDPNLPAGEPAPAGPSSADDARTLEQKPQPSLESTGVPWTVESATRAFREIDATYVARVLAGQASCESYWRLVKNPPPRSADEATRKSWARQKANAQLSLEGEVFLMTRLLRGRLALEDVWQKVRLPGEPPALEAPRFDGRRLDRVSLDANPWYRRATFFGAWHGLVQAGVPGNDPRVVALRARWEGPLPPITSTDSDWPQL